MNYTLFLSGLLLMVGSSLKGSEVMVTRTVTSIELSKGDTSNLTAQERKQCDEYFAYWKRLDARHNNLNRINASLTLHGLQGAVPGGIAALAHLTNEGRSVTLISAMSNPDPEWQTTDIFAEELMKSLLLPYFSVWMHADDPVLFFIDRFHEQEFDFEHEFANLSAFARGFYCKRVPTVSPALEFIVRTVAERSCKVDEALRFGSLHFDASNEVRDRLLARGKLPFVNSPAAYVLGETTKMITGICVYFTQLDVQLKQNSMKEQLSQASSFAQTMVRQILKKRGEISLGAYVDLFKDIIHDFEKAQESASHSHLKSKIKEECEQLRLLAQQLEALFAAQTPEWHKVTVEQFMLNIAKEIHSGHELILRLYKLITYVHSVSKIMQCAMLVELMERYKHCVVFARDLSEDTLTFLREMGFKGDVHGTIARAGEMVANKGTPFKATEIVTFLDAVSKTIKADYNEVTDPRLFHEINPFLEFVEDPFLPDEIRIKGQAALTLGKTTRYVNLFTKEPSDRPCLDNTQVSCSQCEKKLPLFRAVTTSADEHNLCSSTCFARWFIKKSALQELLEKRVVSKEDKKVLQQLAALCALRYLTLSPQSRSCESLFFAISHEKLKKLLIKLFKEGASHPLWIKTFKLAEALSIDLRNLSVFCDMYRSFKNDYLHELLARAKKRRYKDLEHEAGIHFDPREYVFKYQKKQFETLRSQWKLSSSTSLELLPTLYLEVLKLLSSKVSFTFDLLEQYLEIGNETIEKEKPVAVRPTHRPVLRRVPKQKSVKKAKKIELVVEETETLDTLDELFDEQLPVQEPEDISSEHNNFVLQAIENSTAQAIPEIKASPIEFHDFECVFAHAIPYTIRLYDVSLLVPEEEQTGRALWMSCTKLRESIRLQTLRALAQNLEDASSVSRTEYGTYLLRCDDDTFDATIKAKLDLHHLFPQKIDRYVQRSGVVELLEGPLIQLSLPGSISYDDGTVEKGFFQLTYIPETWICIHRCFKVWNQQKSKYISPLLAGIIEKVIQ